MNARPAYALIGLFVLLLGGALFATVIWLGATRSDRPTTQYVAYMTESVTGLNVKSAVRYRGVEVGRVATIALDRDDPGRVRLLLAIDAGTPIRVDTVAKLATQGITGLAYIELSGGSAAAAPLLPAVEGAPAQIATAPSLLGRIDQAAPRLITELERSTRLLGDAAERITDLFSADNRVAVGTILGDLQQVTAVLGARAQTLGNALERFDAALVGGAAAAERMPVLLARANSAMGSIEAAGDEVSIAAGKVVDMAGRMDGIMVALQQGPVHDVAELTRLSREELTVFSQQTHPDLLQLLTDLQATSGSLRRLTEALADNPSLLLFGRSLHPRGPGEEGASP